MSPPSDTATLLGPSLLGHLLRSAADLPRQPSTDALLLQAVLQADARAFQSPEFRSGLAACLARARYPEDEETRAMDAAQWEALFSEPLGEQLLSDAQLTPEQRQAHLSFFLLRPEFSLELLSLYEGHLTRVAAHEAQLALQAFPAEQVAPIARFPPALVARFPDLTAIEPPVTAQAISLLVPHVLRPAQVSRMLGTLADDILATAQEDAPEQAHRSAFASMAAEGLRALAEELRTQSDPRQVAQELVLGGLQYQAFFQLLGPFTEDARAQHELLSTSVSHLGMALGGPVGEAAARVVSRQVFQAVEVHGAGGRLPLGALAGEVLGVPGLGLAPGALSEVTSALTQLYAAQLTALEDDAADLLSDVMPLLFQGEVEGLGSVWASLLGDPERMATLQALDAQARAQVLRVLLVGGAVGLFPWEAVVPGLQASSPELFGASLAPNVPAERYAASAARAVAVLANEELCEQLSQGLCSPEEALEQAQERGAALFEGGLLPADPALTTALLGAVVPLQPTEE
ncbi:hypothetical protein [Hyalangium rubrum]|uniref:Uncharacterized protein n=1 Tax=Hyalangium rubrum TaxID=3103134 RepID=A0ABU5H7H0_9BACT|nr:hypothetical protein [Hyalangium sp. s54d21]MDY7229290.1 hypothetical protein [Hyalangium sp. s54d21]